MKRVTTLLLLAGVLAAQDKIGAGTYKGSWENSGGGGDFHIAFTPGDKVDIGFTVEGQEVPCRVTSVKLNGATVESSCEFDLQGNKQQLNVKGTLKGKALEGTFTLGADGDSGGQGGTWKTTLQ